MCDVVRSRKPCISSASACGGCDHCSAKFGPALKLPARLKRSRVAALARPTSSCRDADVLRENLAQRLLERLESRE